MKRPHIPLAVRESVVDRQMRIAGFRPSWASQQGKSVAKRLRMKLEEFFGCRPVELHHAPALTNRERVVRWVKGHGDEEAYVPPANDPEYLVYLPADDHDIETRVRGQHGQYADLALARKRKRIARKKLKRFKRKILQRVNPWPRKSYGN